MFLQQNDVTVANLLKGSRDELTVQKVADRFCSNFQDLVLGMCPVI